MNILAQSNLTFEKNCNKMREKEEEKPKKSQKGGKHANNM